jgi:hypothetical protein
MNKCMFIVSLFPHRSIDNTRADVKTVLQLCPTPLACETLYVICMLVCALRNIINKHQTTSHAPSFLCCSMIMTKQRASALLSYSLIWCSVVPSETLTLMCHQPNFTCPGTPVSCECQGGLTVVWNVLSAATSSALFTPFEFISDPPSPGMSAGNFTGILGEISGQGRDTVLTSKLNFSISENVIVQCRDNFQGPVNATLQMASESLAHYTLVKI